MQHHDGNILAGPLSDVFAVDATTARALCTGCGAVAELATAMVYDTAMGSVVRCRDCDAVLLALVSTGDRVFVNFIGTGAIEFVRP